MGHSQASKAQTHERIVAIASKRFREAGLEGIGVADVMKEAGFTVGGFYKHFDSREALVTEAIDASFGTWQAQVDAVPSGGKPLTIEDLLGNYLDTAHRDNPGRGCAMGALASEIARSNPATRELCTDQLEHNVELVAGLLEQEDASNRRAKAILAFSAMVGAISLARISSGVPLSEEILRTVNTALKQLLSD